LVTKLVKNFRVDKKRLERFDFTTVETLRESIEQKPELRKRLGEDFEGALRAEGVVIDEDFRTTIRQQWREQIHSDLRAFMEKQPESKKRHYSRVAEGKPIKVSVKIDRKKGRREIGPRRDDV
jgi:hypothetical protein